MKTGIRGTFVLSWTQTELDGLAAAPPDALAVGASWLWHGSPARVDGPDDILVLGLAEETEELRRHAGKAVRRFLGRNMELSRADRPAAPKEPGLERSFSVTDGRRRYTTALIERDEGLPLCLFLDDLPPSGRELWVTDVTGGASTPHFRGDLSPSVICFTPDTVIATPGGPRLVAELAEGDLVQTKDDGAQPVRWVGRRRVSGARLYTMPELRPVRIRAGAVGMDVPDADLIVSPQHRMLIRGAVARDLFSADEVLVAAKDMVNDHSILVDRQLREVTYVHLLLDRHSILFANGLETESFHPATMDLTAMDALQRDELADRVPGVATDPSVYGAYARRMLSRSEAAILDYAVRGPH
ncbi:Hint domain-containing protein [Pseudoruegeria sp. HB172150]|uniref:Hint domain-containing protein n=1 Tax=Pseudoruegeria sp. HB172150 TaxID=2721164 RepID=UPI001554036F|nr:Hint domain-containing protein [Pseudoruegeria sp. HB172150]